MQSAGRIRRPPLRARLLAEIKSPAICWEAKTSLSAGAYSLEQVLMWQNLSEPLTLWGEAGAAPGLAVDFWWLCQAPNAAAARPVCRSPGATPWPEGELGHGRVKNICSERQHQPCKRGKRLPSLALHSMRERPGNGGWWLESRAPEEMESSLWSSPEKLSAFPSLTKSEVTSSSKAWKNHYETQELAFGVCKVKPKVLKSNSVCTVLSPPNSAEVSSKWTAEEMKLIYLNLPKTSGKQTKLPLN